MKSRTWVCVTVVSVAATLMFPLAAQAKTPSAPPLPKEVAGPISAEITRTVGPNARPTSHGYNVRLDDGKVLYTHGPDARPSTRNGGGVGASLGAQRTPVCATDKYQRLLYARPAGSTDNSATAIPALITVFKQINNILNETAIGTSGSTVTADYKVWCGSDGTGDIEVSAFTVPSGQVSFGQVASAASSAGFNLGNVDYSIFFDSPATSACGVGSFYGDERPIDDNWNNNPTGAPASYAVTYGGPSRFGTNDDCWQSTTPMHEDGHMMGAVQGLDPANPENPDSTAMVGSPNATGDGGHCQDGVDVMCYADGGSDENCGDFLCSGTCATEEWDCGDDDYFDAQTETGEYLETHWNIGHPRNDYIAFGVFGTQVRMSAAARSVGENAGTLTLTVQRLGDPTPAFSVTVNANPGTAVTPADFTDIPTDTVLNFNNGDITKTVQVPIINDALKEAAESFTVTLTNVVPADAGQPVTLGSIPTQTITVAASDQQPDGYIKLAGGSYRGANIYNTTASGQTIATSARRGVTKTFYVVLQNDGNVSNRFWIRGLNTGGTTMTVKDGATNVTTSVRSSTGRAYTLAPGAARLLRVDFKMGTSTSSTRGTEYFTMTSSWLSPPGDRLIRDIVKGTVRIV